MRLLGREPDISVVPGEAWSDVALKDLEELDEGCREAWAALIKHSQSASSGKRSAGDGSGSTSAPAAKRAAKRPAGASSR